MLEKCPSILYTQTNFEEIVCVFFKISNIGFFTSEILQLLI